MRKPKQALFKLYLDITGSIAFYPSLISFGFLFFSFLIMLIEYEPFIIDVKENISIVLVQGEDNARLILGTIVGGIISLMVFSFSMVMLVLSRASTALSPRVIPGLVSDKSHQVVLGVYLGTIIYSLVLIINIQSSNADYQVPSLGVLLAMVFGISCLSLFVYFIHSISKAIQTDNILDTIFKETLKYMDLTKERFPGIETVPDTQAWEVIRASQPGYFKTINIKKLLSICAQQDLIVHVLEHPGFFLVRNHPFLRVSKHVSEETKNAILSCFLSYPEEKIRDHYMFGLKQISEIAIKALSPGINDPGTAVKALDMLSILLIKFMSMTGYRGVYDYEDHLRIIFKELTLEELLYNNLTPIREYGKSDAVVMYNMLEMLKNLLYSDRENRSQRKVLIKYVESIVYDCQQHIRNKLDQERLNQILLAINETADSDIGQLT